MIKKILAGLEDFMYRVILKNIMKLSSLGRGFIVTGAESGENFERIYDNAPEGRFFIGKYVDKSLLNLTAVQATRQRKDDVKLILWNEIMNNERDGRPTHILDLASGGARYIREIMKEDNPRKVDAICIDKDKGCVRLGRALVRKECLDGKKIRFIRGDVFKLKKILGLSGKIRWMPNVIIASGFFIYFNDQVVSSALQEIHRSLGEGGCVIFTSYESLNSRKLMRKTMKTSSGEAWTLYYRKPEYWRQLLREKGFHDIFITRDRWRMNNVCLARR